MIQLCTIYDLISSYLACLSKGKVAIDLVVELKEQIEKADKP